MTILPQNPHQWKCLSQENGYSNPWISIQKCKAINPAGGEQPYNYVHFKNKAVGIAAIEDGHIWLVGQSRFTIGQYSWELPEGGCPEGETPLETAKRELAEETGLSAKQYQPLLEMHLSNSCTDEWGIVFLAQGLVQGRSRPEASEDITTLKIPLKQAVDAAEAGEITDSLTIAALYKLEIMRLRGQL